MKNIGINGAVAALQKYKGLLTEGKMKAVILSTSADSVRRVYSEAQRKELAKRVELEADILSAEELKRRKSELCDCEAVFSTWGMPALSGAEIAEFLPGVRALFYAAGSVQDFARAFLERGVTVCSAWQANAVPVAEFVFAQITLANKGYYAALRKNREDFSAAHALAEKYSGNYRARVGIIGAGCIGSLVCEKLKMLDCEVLLCDPFISGERFAELGARPAELEEIFSVCDVISNHLANKRELEGVFNEQLFSLMGECATFINSGRGRQVDEGALAAALKAKPLRTALIDVLTDEGEATRRSPLFDCENAFITPHIAGSTGFEVERMAEYMIAEFDRFAAGEELKYSVSMKMLETMA